jgi:hypothetical protein
MRIIITEDQYNSLFVRRRFDEVRGLVKHQYSYENPCDSPDFQTFLDSLIIDIRDYLTLDWFNDENFQYVENFIMTDMRNELRNYYFKKCGK